MMFVKTKLSKRRANANYYARNDEKLRARALARWRRINGKSRTMSDMQEAKAAQQ